jgi:hypothetical protein
MGCRKGILFLAVGNLNPKDLFQDGDDIYDMTYDATLHSTLLYHFKGHFLRIRHGMILQVNEYYVRTVHTFIDTCVHTRYIFIPFPFLSFLFP